MGRLENKAYKIDVECNHGYWQDRVLNQIRYAIGLSDIRGGKYDRLIEDAEDYLLQQWKTQQTLIPEAARQAEAMLLPLTEDAKSFTMHCVSHAHIDMNWMWRFDETVAVTLDTFRTMLDLLGEYPQFTFSQSQAAVYKIVEEFGPEGMLEDIRRYVKEGRWEVTASTWVEADKNMPGGESAVRQLLYTRRYLCGLLDIPPEAVRLDFEPDTFGHSANTPEVLAAASVEYYYHCRGALRPHLSWWRAPSGKKVLAVRDPHFYNHIVKADYFSNILPSCKELGVDTMLRVYGVGDHGGGPSRRDIERLADMQSWPVQPTIVFSTYHAFFDEIKQRFGDKLPVFDSEMNPIFSGCYTSQSRIKTANKAGEETLYEAELYGGLAMQQGLSYPFGRLEYAWEKILFSQFHDILPGSCRIDTREYAMGQFQRCMAVANTLRLDAMRAIAARIDTSRYLADEDWSVYRTEGAGAGLGVSDFKISQVDRGCGSTRVYHVFNPSPYQRTGLAEFTIWDWRDEALPLIEFRNEDGDVVPHQLMKSGTEWYWFHDYATVLLPVSVPAGGYATYALCESADSLTQKAPVEPPEWERIDVPHQYILENDLVRITLDTQTAAITSYLEKSTGKEWMRPGCQGGFRLVEEDTNRGMTSWRVGRYMTVGGLEQVRIKPVYYSGAPLQQSVGVEASWSRSKINTLFTLEQNSPTLRVTAELDWQEKGTMETCIPQLNFALPLNDDIGEYYYDIPFGVLNRAPADIDQAANNFIAALPSNDNSAFLLTAYGKHGYRGYENTVSVALVRSSFNPDPDPECGQHKLQLAFGPVPAKAGDLVRCAFDLRHPFNVLAAQAHSGDLPLHLSLVEVEGEGVLLQALKPAEDQSGALVARLYNVSGKHSTAVCSLCLPVDEMVQLVDVHENVIAGLPAADGKLRVDVPPNTVVSVKMVLRK